MQKTRFYIIRHGEVYNPDKIVYGRLPRMGLSIEGKRQVESTGLLLVNKKINVIYSSPMLRARQSAQIIGRALRVKIKISSLLNEVDLFCKGISIFNYESTIQKVLYSEENVNKGQETVQSIFNRMNKIVKKIYSLHKYSNVVLVSHGDPIMILRALSSNLSFTWEYKKTSYVSPGSWFVFDYDGASYNWVSRGEPYEKKTD